MDVSNMFVVKLGMRQISAFAFVLPFMVWAALRVDDVQWIKRDTLALSELELRSILSRTKPQDRVARW